MRLSRWLNFILIILLFLGGFASGRFEGVTPNSTSQTNFPSGDQINLSQYIEIREDFEGIDAYPVDNFRRYAEGNGYIKKTSQFGDNRSIVALNANNGGYQIYGSERSFTNLDAQATIEFQYLRRGDNLATTMFVGWASEYPEPQESYNWTPLNARNGVFLMSTEVDSQLQLMVIKDDIIQLSRFLSVSVTDFQELTLFANESNVQVEIDNQPEHNVNLQGVAIPDAEMFFYVGISSLYAAGEDDFLYLDKIELQGQMSPSGIPFLVSQYSGYLGHVGVPTVIDWKISDDNPARYEIYVDAELHESGDWTSNELIVRVSINLEAGIYEFELIVEDLDNQNSRKTEIVKIIDGDYFENATFSDQFNGLNDSFPSNWNYFGNGNQVVVQNNDSVKFLQNSNSGTTAIEYNHYQSFESWVSLDMVNPNPGAFGGTAFGWSDMDLRTAGFQRQEYVFSPDIWALSSNAIYVTSLFDGTHNEFIILKNSVERARIYFYLEDMFALHNYKITWEETLIEFYIDNKLLISFEDTSGNRIPTESLKFSISTTSWWAGYNPDAMSVELYNFQLFAVNSTQLVEYTHPYAGPLEGPGTVQSSTQFTDLTTSSIAITNVKFAVVNFPPTTTTDEGTTNQARKDTTYEVIWPR
ncbi:MAG: family 16 glycosylhydrolase, partial [Candidatus Heimdallarchaeota archaeon]|nr:family 16 glycosylhydrolase [Candidatus Heimdallarchaeota archaeon]